MRATAEQDVLTVGEAARFLRVSEKTLREMARLGKLPGHKVGRAWRFLRSALVAWLSHREVLDAVGEPRVQCAPLSTGTEVRPGTPPQAPKLFGDTAFSANRTLPLHRWAPWVAGFSASFVDGILDAAGGSDPAEVTVLDPFAGVGTTLVEALLRGHRAIGFELNPYAALVCRGKAECLIHGPAPLRQALQEFRSFVAAAERRAPRSRPPGAFRSRVPFFSPQVERQVLHVLDFIAGQRDGWLRDVLRAALGAVMVSFSNYSYEPSLGRRASAGKEDILAADVPAIVGAKLEEMIEDTAQAELRLATLGLRPKAEVHCESFLTSHSRLPSHSVDYLITSPPYLNNYHYIRNTRPHVHWLGLVEGPADLRRMEELSFGKFWQTVRAGPRIALEAGCDGLAEAIEEIRRRNPEKGIYGGSGWANYAAAYFNDCLAFCRAAARVMTPGGAAVIVIGNNILQGVEVKTDEFLARIASQCGFEVVGLHRVRRKRTGSSVLHSSVRRGAPTKGVELYETAVELRAPR